MSRISLASPLPFLISFRKNVFTKISHRKHFSLQSKQTNDDELRDYNEYFNESNDDDETTSSPTKKHRRVLSQRQNMHRILYGGLSRHELELLTPNCKCDPNVRRFPTSSLRQVRADTINRASISYLNNSVLYNIFLLLCLLLPTQGRLFYRCGLSQDICDFLNKSPFRDKSEVFWYPCSFFMWAEVVTFIFMLSL